MITTVRPREFGPFLLGDFAWQVNPARSDYDGSTFGPEWFEKCLQSKLSECGPKFRQSVRDEGFTTPVKIRFAAGFDYEPDFIGPKAPMLTDGHHRWAYAYEHDLEVPVEFLGPNENSVASYNPGPDSYR